MITSPTPASSPLVHRRRRRPSCEGDDKEEDNQTEKEPFSPPSPSSPPSPASSLLARLSAPASLLLVVLAHLLLFSLAVASLNSLSALLASAGVDARVVMITNNHKPLVISSAHGSGGGHGGLSAPLPLPIALLQQSIIRSGKYMRGECFEERSLYCVD